MQWWCLVGGRRCVWEATIATVASSSVYTPVQWRQLGCIRQSSCSGAVMAQWCSEGGVCLAPQHCMGNQEAAIGRAAGLLGGNRFIDVFLQQQQQAQPALVI